MKYIIDVPDGTKWIEAYYTVDHFQYQGKSIFVDSLIPYIESDRKAIEDEVWEFAKKVYEVIDYDNDIFFGHSYHEMKERYEAWLKQKDAIRVGDEVVDKNGYKGIATYIKCELCDMLWDDGSVTEDINKKDFSKTGRHFPEVAQLLEKMRGEEE